MTDHRKKLNKTAHPDTHYRALDLIHKQPDITQRQLAQQTGISLGSMHYCLKALVAMGWVKAGKFTHNPDKSVYLYLLTPEGILQKSKLAIAFLGRKRAEYHRMQQDIARLSKELDDEH